VVCVVRPPLEAACPALQAVDRYPCAPVRVPWMAMAVSGAGVILTWIWVWQSCARASKASRASPSRLSGTSG
jgi:type VI protein secretion system component VasK